MLRLISPYSFQLVPAVLPELRVKGRKYSSQMKEYVEYDSKVRCEV